MILEEIKRKYLKFTIFCALTGVLFMLNQGSSNLLHAGSITDFDGVYHWRSPNITVRPNDDMSGRQQAESNTGDHPPLKNFAYNFHFDSFGAPPPYDFIEKLKPSESGTIEIDQTHIKFKKYGTMVPLNRSLIPDWADPAKPYALSVPAVDMVLVVYPYYFYQCKENKYFTQVYNMKGALLQTFDSLPTHVAAANPQLLIAPERSGCCESIRWNFRFYNLAQGTQSQILCPEGFCGDVLFTAVDPFEHYLLIQEVVDSVSGVGAYLQTNIYLVDKQGKLAASGNIIFATTDKMINRETISVAAPFSIRKLVTIDRITNDGPWRLHYSDQGHKSTLQIQGQAGTKLPAALFLQGDELVFRQTAATIKIAENKITQLPTMLIAMPGKYNMTIKSAGGSEYNKELDVQSNTVNKLLVELPN
jgi:hypothetical protein